MDRPAVRGPRKLRRAVVIPELRLQKVSSWCIEAARVLLDSRVVARHGTEDVVEQPALGETGEEQGRVQESVPDGDRQRPVGDGGRVGEASEERGQEDEVLHLRKSRSTEEKSLYPSMPPVGPVYIRRHSLQRPPVLQGTV